MSLSAIAGYFTCFLCLQTFCEHLADMPTGKASVQAQGTSTVPIVSAHFRSLLADTKSQVADDDDQLAV